MSAFWRSRLRTRLKPHRCETCHQQINAGEKSYDESGLFEGEISSYKQCRGCHEIVKYFYWRGTFEHGEGYMLFEVADVAREQGLLWPPVYGFVDAGVPASLAHLGDGGAA